MYSMKKYRLLSNYDCLVIENNKEIFLAKGQILEFDSAENLSIYPTSSNKNNIPFKLNLSNNSDSDRYIVAENNNIRTFYLLQGFICENFIISTLEIANDICKFEIGETSLSLTYKHYKKNIQLPGEFSSFKTGILSNCCYCLLTSQKKETLIIFNTKTGKTDLLIGDEINITNNNILVRKNFENIAKHTQESEYVVTTDELTLKSQNISYQNGRPIISTTAQTIPYAFLEAVQVEDYELAFSYLDLSMKRQIDKNHLKEYFGSIKTFFALDTITYAVKNQTEKNIYKFTLTENKISEIDNIK